MKKSNKLIRLFLTLAMIAMLITSCGSASTSEATQTGDTSTGNSQAETKPVVRILMFGVSENDVTDPISGITTLGSTKYEALLNEKNPDIDVQVIAAPWDNWIQKLETMSANGEMDIEFYSNQVDVPNWFVDVTPFLEKDDTLTLDNWEDTFIDPAVHYSYYKTFNYPEATNQIIGLPISLAAQNIMYDAQLFADWGIPEPTGDETFAELVELAAQMTGKNPVTGRQNYGAYIESSWTEWYAISYDAVKKFESDTMILADLDKSEYIDYIKDSPEVLDYMEGISTLVENAPAGISTQMGSEKFFTSDNDIAINFSIKGGQEYAKYLAADKTDVTDRFKPLLIPTGPVNGEAGFPEVSRFAITKTASDPDAAWEVLKAMTTDPELVDYYIKNCAAGKAPVLADVSELTVMEDEFLKMRYEYTMDSMYITDDYWMWRNALRGVNNSLMSKELTPEQARQAFYESANTWYNDTLAQLG